MGHRACACAGASSMIGLCVAMALAAVMAAGARADELAEARRAAQACEHIVEPRTPAPFDTTEIQCYFAGRGCEGWSGVAPDGRQGERCAVRVYRRGGRIAALRRLYLAHDAESYQLDEHCYRPDGSLAMLRSEGETVDGTRIDATAWYDANGQELAGEGGSDTTGTEDAAEDATAPPPYLWTAQIDAEIDRLASGQDAAGDARASYASGLSSIEAKRALGDRDSAAYTLLKRRNFHALADLVHPVEGVRLSSRGRVDLSNDRVLTRADVRDLGRGPVMHAGAGTQADSVDIAVEWDFDFYYEHSVYDRDYAFAPQVSYNCPIGDTGAGDTVLNAYDDAIVVEHRFPASSGRSGSSGATGLRLVFERYEGAWYLVGIVHDGSG